LQRHRMSPLFRPFGTAPGPKMGRSVTFSSKMARTEFLLFPPPFISVRGRPGFKQNKVSPPVIRLPKRSGHDKLATGLRRCPDHGAVPRLGFSVTRVLFFGPVCRDGLGGMSLLGLRQTLAWPGSCFPLPALGGFLVRTSAEPFRGVAFACPAGRKCVEKMARRPAASLE